MEECQYPQIFSLELYYACARAKWQINIRKFEFAAIETSLYNYVVGKNGAQTNPEKMKKSAKLPLQLMPRVFKHVYVLVAHIAQFLTQKNGAMNVRLSILSKKYRLEIAVMSVSTISKVSVED